MIDIDGNIITNAEDLHDYLTIARLMPNYRSPASDLGYCLCGTVWNIEAMAKQNFVRGTCPDCGEKATAIEASAAPTSGDRTAQPNEQTVLKQ